MDLVSPDSTAENISYIEDVLAAISQALAGRPFVAVDRQ
jgi:hypothetical protein